MAKRVVYDGASTAAKKQRVIDEAQKAADEKIEFSMDFTPSEERAWIHEERCNTITLVVCIIMAFIVGTVTAFISHTNGYNAVSAVIDTLIVFIVAGLLKKIASPFIKMYVARNFNPAYAEAAGASMLSGRSIAGSVFMYLVMALGTCIVVISLL